jgi:hypothetical protein
MDLEGLRRWELLQVEGIFINIQVNSCIIDASYYGDSALGPASEARNQRFGVDDASQMFVTVIPRREGKQHRN